MPAKSSEIKAQAHKGGWFRLYANIINDPKVQMLPDHLFKFWVNCLALTCEKRGYLPEPREIAFRLHLTLTQVEDDLACLMTHRLVDTDKCAGKTVLQPHNWFNWQPKPDPSKWRMRRHRASKKSTGENGSDGRVTRHVTVGDGGSDGKVRTSTSTVTEGNSSARDALWPSTARETSSKRHPGSKSGSGEVLP